MSARGVSVAFRLPGRLPFLPSERLVAVDRVDLDIAVGETLAVVGESGCGKSTLGRALLRLIEPSAGTLSWDGADLRGFTPMALRAWRREAQIVFQDPLAALDPRMTVGDAVEEALVAFMPDLPPAARRDRVAETLRAVGIDPRLAERFPHEFSGGMCQRVAIARAIVGQPRLVVCDEPVSALDVSIQAQILNLLIGLKERDRLALLFISHNLAVVRSISDRVMVLYLGRVVEVAATERLFTAPRHPYTRALLAAVPVPDPRIARHAPPPPILGEPPSPLDPPSGCAFRTRCPHAIDRCAEERPVLELVVEEARVACHRWREFA
jgi:oligopeptide transport system ATP-binding protein